MTSWRALILLVGALVAPTQQDQTDVTKAHHLHGEVINLLKQQVGMELRASTTYLAMAAHFGGETVNRLGFAKFFKESSNEEFKHAQMFINYLNKRGVALDADNFKVEPPFKTKWRDGLDALHNALELEGRVTDKLMIIHAAANNDGHLTNFIESEFLEEQVNSMRQLSGYVHNLHSMTEADQTSRNMLAEYLFDLQLQKESPQD